MSFFRFKPVLVAFIILPAFYLQTLPLTNSLDYEFSAVMGLLYFIAGGIFIIKSGYDGNALQFIKSNRYFLAALLAIPLIISATGTIFLSLCPLRQGIQFFLFISVISFILGALTGLSARTIAVKHYYILFFLFIAGFVLVSILEIYFYPQIFTYNPLIGMLPGTIYDELIEFDFGLVFYRIYNLIMFGAFLYSAVFLRKKLPSVRGENLLRKLFNVLYSFSFLAAFFLIYWFMNLFLGFTIPVSSIEKELGGRLETEHFVIIYPKEIKKEEALISALHHEFYFSLVSKELKLEPEGKITSLLFPSAEVKKRLIGSANADMAKPWMNLIISDMENHDRTLKHELVHAMSAGFGGRVFKLPYGFNPVLLEGLASAVENKFDIYDLEAAASMIRKYKEKISVAALFSGFNFFGQSSSIAYAYSGAFVRYLIDKYGIERFKFLYTDPDFSKYYGKSPAELENEFRSHIDSMKYAYNPNAAILYFSGKPVFMKKCPRYAAYGMKLGNEAFGGRNYEKALELYSDIYSVTESYAPLSGMVNSFIRLNKEKEAMELLEKEKAKFRNTNNEFILQIQLSDLYIRNGYFEKGRVLLDSLINKNPHPDYYFLSSLKKELLAESPAILKQYVKGEKEERKKIVMESKKLPPLYKAYWLYLFGDKMDMIGEIPGEDIQVNNEVELRMLLGGARGLKDEGKFDEAAKLLTEANRYSFQGMPFKRILSEDIQKINYFRNFKDKIKESIKFSNE